MSITTTIAAIEAAATAPGGLLLVPTFDDFRENGVLYTARWQRPPDGIGDITPDGWGSTIIEALDNLLLIMTGRAAEVDRASRLRAAKAAQMRARTDADAMDAVVIAIEAEPIG